MNTDNIDVLAVIKGAANFMDRNPSTDESEHVEKLRESSEALSDLIERGRALQRHAGRHEWAAFAQALARVEPKP